VIYQIYPRSYQDSNGDGIGDLAGITSRLPYIASLGVDAIWISPFFTSPMKDFGYDVSDYCDIDPMFGTLADFDVMLDTAHGLGIRVMIDLVLSHTSDQHPWFAESRASRDNPKSDWYVWADPKPDGTPPNNWLSIFGGSAWQWDARREQYYLHNFLTSQPDLNFHTPAVQDAVLDVTRFWLERGVDGFRLDTINFYIHDKQLRDNPPLPKEQRNATIAPSVNPYNHQLHLYSKNQPENLAFLQRFRALLDQYDSRAYVGEVGDAQKGLEIMAEYTADGDKAHMCYAFELLEPTKLTAARVAEVFARVDSTITDGWACWAYSNHDVVRHASRWALSDAAIRAYTTLQMCLPGSVCIYQGEELGLPEADVAFEDLQDPYGIEFWPEFKGRDGCRTPMVWEAQAENAGFGGGKPWLPVSPEQAARAVSRQEGDEGSVLAHYRRAIALRQAHGALQEGAHSPLTATGDVLHFTRSDDGVEIFCAFNLSDDPATLAAPAGAWENLAAGLGGAGVADGTLALAGWQAAILRRMAD
jgi:alpha-glucosidase